MSHLPISCRATKHGSLRIQVQTPFEDVDVELTPAEGLSLIASIRSQIALIRQKKEDAPD